MVSCDSLIVSQLSQKKPVPSPPSSASVAARTAILTDTLQKDFRLFQDHLAPEFAFMRLGKTPESRQTYLKKMSKVHEHVSNEQVCYYLVQKEKTRRSAKNTLGNQ